MAKLDLGILSLNVAKSISLVFAAFFKINITKSGFVISAGLLSSTDAKAAFSIKFHYRFSDSHKQ